MHRVSEDTCDRLVELLLKHLSLDAEDIAYLANRILGICEYELRVAIERERRRWSRPSAQ